MGYNDYGSNWRISGYMHNVTIDGTPVYGAQAVGLDRGYEYNSLRDQGRMRDSHFFTNPDSLHQITIDRVIDGGSIALYSGINYLSDGQTSYETNHLLADANLGSAGWIALRKKDVCINYGTDKEDHMAGAIAGIRLRDAIMTSLSYSLDSSGSLTESSTWVSPELDYEESFAGSYGKGTVSDVAHTASDLIRRQHVKLADCVFPDLITENIEQGSTYSASKMLDITEGNADIGVYGLTGWTYGFDIDFGTLQDNGRPGVANTGNPHQFRYVNVPVTVSSSFTAIARKEGAFKMDRTQGTYDNPDFGTTFKPDDHIRLSYWNATGTNILNVDLGARNYLTGINLTGSDASGGGNLEYEITFENKLGDFLQYTGAVTTPTYGEEI